MSEKRIYTIDEVNAYHEIVKGTKMELPVLLTAYYGLELYDMLDFQMSCINFDTSTITYKDRSYDGRGLLTIPLIDVVATAIYESKARLLQFEAENEKNYHYSCDDFVCRNDNSDYMTVYVSVLHTRLLKKHGLRHIALRDLRFSCLTMLLSQGVSIEKIEQWLGPKNIKKIIKYEKEWRNE
jgi:integrase